MQTKEMLKQQIFELTDENDRLKHIIDIEHPVAITKLKDATRVLEDTIKKQSIKISNIPKLKSEEKQMISKLEDTIVELESKLLDLQCSHLDLTYEHNHHEVLTTRLRTRIFELSQLNRLLSAQYDAELANLPEPLASIVNGVEKDDKKDNKENKMKTTTAATSPQIYKKKDLGTIIMTFAKVIERLKNESDMLKKNSHTNIDYMSLVKSNATLKKKMAALQLEHEQTKTELNNQPSNLKRELDRLHGVNTQMRKDIKKEQDSAVRWKSKCNELILQIESREQQILKLNNNTNISGDDDFNKKEQMYQQIISDNEFKLRTQEQELTSQKSLLSKMRVQMSSMGEIIDNIKSTQSNQYSNDIPGRDAHHTESELKEEFEILLKERDKLKFENEAYKQGKSN
jgi:hypothetical protein